MSSSFSSPESKPRLSLPRWQAVSFSSSMVLVGINFNFQHFICCTMFKLYSNAWTHRTYILLAWSFPERGTMSSDPYSSVMLFDSKLNAIYRMMLWLNLTPRMRKRSNPVLMSLFRVLAQQQCLRPWSPIPSKLTLVNPLAVLRHIYKTVEYYRVLLKLA